MINLSTMVGHITGKSVESAPTPGPSAGGEAGASGAFAALVQQVARAGHAMPSDPDIAVEAVSAESMVALMDDAGEPGEGAGQVHVTPPQGAPWRPFADARAGMPSRLAVTAPANAVVRPGQSGTPEAEPGMTVERDLSGGNGDEPGGHDVLPSAGESPEGDRADMGRTACPATDVVAMPTSAALPAGAVAVASAAPWAGQRTDDRPLSGADDAAGGDGRSAPVDAGWPVGRIALNGASPREIPVKFSARPAVATASSSTAIAPEGEMGDGADAGRRFDVTAAAREPASGGGIAPAGGAGSTGPGGMPLRMIVDSLPPVVQSSLGPVATVRGPSTGQQLGDQVIDMGVAGQWIDRMAREITALAEGGGHSRFTLNPPHLGRLQVDLWQGQDATSVRFVAETDEAARRLGEGRAALHVDARLAALNLASITIEKAALSQESPREGGGQAQQQAAGHGQAQGQHQARAGRDEAQGEGAGRPLRDEQDQQGGATPQRVARDHVRFA